MDIALKTAKTMQNAANAAKQSTPLKNATAPQVNAANATEITRHGTITAQLESAKRRDSRHSGDKLHEPTEWEPVVNQ